MCGNAPALGNERRTPKAGFLFIPKYVTFMSQKINLAPVEELLTHIASPESLSKTLDAIAFDYVRALFEVQLAKGSKTYLNDRTVDFVWYLYLLRDVFKSCESK